MNTSTSSLNVTPSLATAVCICDYAMNSYIYFNNLAAAVVSSLLAVLTALSNVAVMVTIIRTASLHSPASILLCSLSFGDFLVAVFPIPVLVALLVSTSAGTDCCLYEKLIALHQSSLGIVFGCTIQVCVMCWDRFKATSKPFRYRAAVSKKKIMAITVAGWVAWLINFVIANTVLTSYEIKAVKGAVEIVTFVCICVVSQILTFRAIRVHNSEVGGVVLQATALAREKKMAVTLRWIIGVNFVSGVPFLVYIVSAPILGKDNLFCSLLEPWAKIAFLLNSAVDPVLYFWRHKNMRNAALELVRS